MELKDTEEQGRDLFVFWRLYGLIIDLSARSYPLFSSPMKIQISSSIRAILLPLFSSQYQIHPLHRLFRMYADIYAASALLSLRTVVQVGTDRRNS